uniref:Uncharacterized protein n=1 Tax=Rhizophora mucronata TaxID=61149 RepID=A0A2P2IS41_RHIMU
MGGGGGVSAREALAG